MQNQSNPNEQETIRIPVIPRVMRSVLNVISEMLAIIPSSEAGLKQELMKVQISANYVPPEMQDNWWMKVAHLLYQWMPNPNCLNEQQKRVLNLFCGRGIDDVARPDDYIVALDLSFDVSREGVEKGSQREAYLELRKYVLALESQNAELKEFKSLYNNEQRIITAL